VIIYIFRDKVKKNGLIDNIYKLVVLIENPMMPKTKSIKRRITILFMLIFSFIALGSLFHSYSRYKESQAILENVKQYPPNSEKYAGDIEIQLLKDLSAHRTMDFYINIVVIILIIVSISVFLKQYVNKPLKIIEKSLLTRNPGTLDALKHDETEFGRLREIILEFFDQEALIREVEKRNYVEAELAKSEEHFRNITVKLSELNAAKDKFFSIMAHDLKNPFNAILGFSQTLAEEYDHYSESERKQFLRNIYDASHSSFNLVQNMLEWSRTQTGMIEFKPVLHDLSHLANETVRLLKHTAEMKNIRLISLIPFSTIVFADENMVRFIFRNLISNAIKFTNADGKVTVVATPGKDGLTEICVADNGIGIPDQYLSKLFRIDEKYKTEGTRGEQGTGLGLIICKEFALKNGGNIWCESTVGEGSKFFFRLPVN
jgi:signal transduction histidine kinase